MLLWVSFAILTAAVVAYLLRPLRQSQTASVGADAADLAVYRDQLKELESEHERGLIADGELENARAEVARRLIKRADGKDTLGSHEPAEASARARGVYAGIAAVVPLAGVAVYLALGSPNLPGQPFATREAQTEIEAPIAGLIKKVEERLKEHPEDGKGWDVIAPVYLRIGRYPEAAHAFAQANRLEGESPRRLSGFAEATLLAEKGIVTDAVRQTALRLLQLEPDRIQPRVWLALAREQDGDLAGAATDYRRMLTGAPEDAPWRDAVAERLMLVEARLRGEDVEAKSAEIPKADKPQPERAPAPAAGDGSGMSAADIAAMSREQQDAFVMDMVNRLAARLEESPQDLEGWMRLARAYKVVGQDNDARAAIAKARKTFAGDDEALKRIAGAEEALDLAAKEEKSAQ